MQRQIVVEAVDSAAIGPNCRSRDYRRSQQATGIHGHNMRSNRRSKIPHNDSGVLISNMRCRRHRGLEIPSNRRRRGRFGAETFFYDE